MPDLKNATEWQRSFLSEVERALATRAQHTGPNDDHYKFTKSGIYGYVKLFSIKARTNPSGGVKVIVQELPWSLARTDPRPHATAFPPREHTAPAPRPASSLATRQRRGLRRHSRRQRDPLVIPPDLATICSRSDLNVTQGKTNARPKERH